MQHLGQMALISLLISAPLAARAQTANDGNRVVVRTNDLDLTLPQDARVLARRLHTAAGEACGPQPAALDLARMRVWRACASEAFDLTLEHSPLALRAVAMSQRPQRTIAAK